MSLRFVRNFLQQRLSDAVDDGKPLSVFLTLAVRYDPQLRRYYDDLLRLEKRLKDDLPGFLDGFQLSTQGRAGGENRAGQGRGGDVAIPDSFRFQEPKRAARFPLRAASLAASLLLAFGLTYYLLSDKPQNFVDPPQQATRQDPPENPFEQIITPLKTSLLSQSEVIQSTVLTTKPPIPESLKIVKFDWNEKNLRLDPESIHHLAAKSQEMMSQIPLVDETYTLAKNTGLTGLFKGSPSP